MEDHTKHRFPSLKIYTHAATVYFNNLLFSVSVQLDTQDGVLLVDYSKNIITEETMKLLMNLVCTIIMSGV